MLQQRSVGVVALRISTNCPRRKAPVI